MSKEFRFRAWHIEKKAWIAGFGMWGYTNFYPDGYPSSISVKEDAVLQRFDSSWKEHEYILTQQTQKTDKKERCIYVGDIVNIERDGDKYNGLFGEVKQLDGGQYFIDHQHVSFKYKHQIHCEVCDTDAPLFFLEYFDPYELEIIGNIFANPELIPA